MTELEELKNEVVALRELLEVNKRDIKIFWRITRYLDLDKTDVAGEYLHYISRPEDRVNNVVPLAPYIYVLEGEKVIGSERIEIHLLLDLTDDSTRFSFTQAAVDRIAEAFSSNDRQLILEAKSFIKKESYSNIIKEKKYVKEQIEEMKKVYENNKRINAMEEALEKAKEGKDK